MTANKFLKIFLCPSCLCLALLTACGQKGPLYLPEQPPLPAQDAPQEPAEPDEPLPGAVVDPVPEPVKSDDDKPY